LRDHRANFGLLPMSHPAAIQIDPKDRIDGLGKGLGVIEAFDDDTLA
jgi:hypothetical protein